MKELIHNFYMSELCLEKRKAAPPETAGLLYYDKYEDQTRNIALNSISDIRRITSVLQCR